jgi:hypothetical protein
VERLAEPELALFTAGSIDTLGERTFDEAGTVTRDQPATILRMVPLPVPGRSRSYFAFGTTCIVQSFSGRRYFAAVACNCAAVAVATS